MSPSQPRLDDLRIERGSQPVAPKRAASVVLVATIVVVVTLAVWWAMRPKPLEVRTAVAREVVSVPGAGRTVLNASGYVTARRNATVSSKITGKVTEVLIEEGVKVSEGQVLARLDGTNVQASLDLAQAQLNSVKSASAETRVRLREAEQEWQRQKTLLSGNISTQADYDHAEAAALAGGEPRVRSCVTRKARASVERDPKVGESTPGCVRALNINCRRLRSVERPRAGLLLAR